MAHDVLAHHDGIVDEDADGEAERHQGEHVQREAERCHHHEGAEHGNGKRQAGDHSAAPRMQEQEHDGDGEQTALDHCLLHVADRVLDAARAVAHDLQLYIGRHDGLKLSNSAAHAAGDLDGVRTLRLDHVDGQRPLAVLGGDALQFLLTVDHGRDLAQIDRGKATAGHDQIGEVSRLGDAAGDLDDAVVVAAGNIAGREVLVLVPDRPHDVVDADAQRMHASWIELDVDLTLDPAGDGGAPDVAHGLQALDDELVGDRGQIAHRTDVGAHGDRHDRLVVRIEALDQRLLDLRLEGRADLLDLLADVLQGHGRLYRELELGNHDRAALQRARRQRLEAGDRVDRLLDLAADLGLDGLRRGAGVLGGDDDDRKVDVGELVDAELAVREQAHHQQRHHHHGGEDRVVDGDLGELHRRAPTWFR
jgi:hypothetical protein